MAAEHFEYRDDLTSADFAFNAYGDTLENLFVACADGLLSLMISNVGLIKPKIKKAASFAATSPRREQAPEDLLHDFLQYILFLKDSEALFVRVASLRLTGNKLVVELAGDHIDQYTNALGTDVKGITMHHFQVRKLEDDPRGKWSATVVVDA